MDKLATACQAVQEVQGDNNRVPMLLLRVCKAWCGMMETNVIQYFCVTCQAGPWGQNDKDSSGKELIYQMHAERGHRVEIFNKKNHESLASGVRVGESDFKEPTDEEKEIRKKEEMEDLLQNGRGNNSEEWAISRLTELLIFVNHDISKPKLQKKIVKWCFNHKYEVNLKLIYGIIEGVFDDELNRERIKQIAFDLGRQDKFTLFDRSQTDEVAYWIMGRYYVKRIELTGDLLFWNDRVYDTKAIALIRRACRKIFTSSLNRDLTEVLRLIEDTCDVVTWVDVENSVHLKALENGTYNIKTGEFVESFSPDNLILNLLPHSFIDNPWDDIENVVSTIITDQTDRESFEDFLSLCFHPYNGIHIQFGGVGPPGTGKSQLAELAIMTVGSKNVRNAAIHQLAEDQTTQKQVGYAMLNIDSDLSGESIEHIDVIKKWVTQDNFTARGIYEQPVDFRPTSRLLFFANELYELPNPDDADAIYERTHLIKIENKFRGSQKEIKSIMKSTVTEEQLNGFVTFLLRNATEIWKNQKIRHPMTFQTVEDNWNLFGNRIKEFIAKWIEIGADYRSEQNEPYDRWLSYALEKGYHNKDKRKFKKIFEELMGSSPTVSRIEGEQTRVYHGFRVKNRREVEEEERTFLDERRKRDDD